MVFYVTMLTFIMTFLMYEFSSTIVMIEIWMKSMLIIEIKYGKFYILTFL